MLIINADDFGRNRLATDRIVECYTHGSLTSTSAMVFMEDSARAAGMARKFGIDVGLHLNFSEDWTGMISPASLSEAHRRISRFLRKSRFASLFYNPILRRDFHDVFRAQLDEFLRLYGAAPSHFDGHHHMHLCANVLIDGLISKGQKVRRNFSFAANEKSFLNRAYRWLIDRWLLRRYRCTDFLFALSPRLQTEGLGRIITLASERNVELETHPENSGEFVWLTGTSCTTALSSVSKGSYADL